MPGCFNSKDSNGKLLYHYYRGSELMPDNQELLAQGRHAENSQIKRDYNRLPSFPSVDDARSAFEAGKITGVYGSWSTWKHRVDADLDAFRECYSIRNGLAA